MILETNNIIQVIEGNENVKNQDISNIKALTESYPYFHLLRIAKLKILKDEDSFKYNKELKIVAAQTTDRKMLFDFITSSNHEDKKTVNFSDTKSTIKDKVLQAKQDLQIGKPLNFKKEESYSFQQWMQLSSRKEVIRVKHSNKKIALQNSIIDNFISSNPKIPKIDKNSKIKTKVENTQKDSTLMTETLAKIYLEQQKYDKAIKSYEILSLKYPEKSIFFANQIRKIKIIKNSK